MTLSEQLRGLSGGFPEGGRYSIRHVLPGVTSTIPLSQREFETILAALEQAERGEA